jgi:hypothetical protein
MTRTRGFVNQNRFRSSKSVKRLSRSFDRGANRHSYAKLLCKKG